MPTEKMTWGLTKFDQFNHTRFLPLEKMVY